MRPRTLATAVAAILVLAACSREQTGNQDFVTFGVVPFLISTASVQSKADAHCAQYGRRAALADDFGLTMKFDCVEPAKPAIAPFVP
jgi:hypothetical protein